MAAPVTHRLGMAGTLALLLLSGSGILAAGEAHKTAAGFPKRSLNMIVPFGAGGATDLIARSIAVGMEEYLGVSIAVNNMPGSASAVGNEYVMNAPHDGYTILCQPTDITSIKVMGQSKLTYKDWDFLYIAAGVPTVIGVHPDSPIKTIDDFVNAMKADTITIATSDSGCAFTRGVGLILRSETGLKRPELIPSGGGNPAALSCVKGDVDAVACGLPECIDLVRSGVLRPIVYFGASAIDIDGAQGKIRIPCISEKYPDLQPLLPFGGWVSVAMPKGTDPEILDLLAKAVKYSATKKAFTDFLAQKTFVPVGLTGKEADKWAEDSSYTNSYLLFDMGFAKTDPASFGWPRP
ncbi:MAG: tripartite tricarboxylate transporter substrate binding protein [Planctomycetota bacterium]|nr:tripartite tricarboxylate transporter substrate binding protein [Planctomycetota bacterium]